MSRVVITDRERLAVVALERIAARGIAVRTDFGLMINVDTGAQSPAFRCGVCALDQDRRGPCENRDCLTGIARAALDDLRRLT